MNLLSKQNKPSYFEIIGIILVAVIFFFLLISAVLLPEFLFHINFTYSPCAFLQQNWLWFLIAFIACGLIFLIVKTAPPSIFGFCKKIKVRHIVVFGIVMFVLQQAIVVSNFFVAGWDVHVIYYDDPGRELYFSHYPNNLFLRGLSDFSRNYIMPVLVPMFQQFCSFLGHPQPLSSDLINYMFFVLINCVCINVATCMMYFILDRKFNKVFSFWYWVLYIFLVNFISWILVPYTDIFSLCIIVAVIYERTFTKNKFNFYCVALPTVIIGFAIKPTVVFVLVSFMAFDFVKIMQKVFVKKSLLKFKKCKIDPKYILKKFIILVASCVLAFTFVGIVKIQSNFEVDQNQEFSMWHFVMLGLNTQTDGTLNEEELAISANCNNCFDREETNKEEINKRLNELGPLGIMQLYAKKLVGTFSDGSFAWHLDGGASFSYADAHINTFLTGILDAWKPFKQILWFIVLIGCTLVALVGIALFKEKRKKYFRPKNKFMCDEMLPVSGCTLFMFVCFMAIFECGARYVVSFLPVIFIFSAYGLYYALLNIKENKI